MQYTEIKKLKVKVSISRNIKFFLSVYLKEMILGRNLKTIGISVTPKKHIEKEYYSHPKYSLLILKHIVNDFNVGMFYFDNAIFGTDGEEILSNIISRELELFNELVECISTHTSLFENIEYVKKMFDIISTPSLEEYKRCKYITDMIEAKKNLLKSKYLSQDIVRMLDDHVDDRQ